MAIRADITPEILRQLIRINDTGDGLVWLKRPRNFCSSEQLWKSWNSRYAGRPALTAISGGYKGGQILTIGFKAHRVMWALFYGCWPTWELDHIDGDPFNNRISNLRDVIHTVNQQNRRRCTRNKSGHIGVYWHGVGRKWRAVISSGKKRIDLGLFTTIEEAVRARQDAEKSCGFHVGHGR